MTDQIPPPSGTGVPPSPPRLPRAQQRSPIELAPQRPLPAVEIVAPPLSPPAAPSAEDAEMLRPSEVYEVALTIPPGAPIQPPTLANLRMSRPPSPNEARGGREKFLEGVLVYLELLLKHAPADDLAATQEVVREALMEIENALKKS